MQTEQQANRAIRNAKLQESIAKGAIYFFAGLTIVIAVWIVGYIFYKGFYYDTRPRYEVIDTAENSLFLEQGVEEAVFIRHKRVDTDELTIADLRTIYTKPRRENWGFYTQQDIKVYPYILDPSYGDFAVKTNAYILEGAPEPEMSKYTEVVQTPEEMIRTVAETPGGLGYIPASYIDRLKKVGLIETRRYSVIVNPEVTEVRNNNRLLYVDAEMLAGIFEGTITNWKTIGGIDLPVIPVYLQNEAGEGLYSDPVVTEPGTIAAHGIRTGSKEELLAVLQETPGAVGIADYTCGVINDLPVLKVERQETGLNLTFRFLVEAPARSGKWGGISYIIINTFFLILFTLIFSTPIGIAAAVFLVEYARQGKLIKILRMGTETLAAIPSIVFGLFGYIFFVNILGFGIGFISSTLAVTLMILPTIIRTTEEALKAVPMSFREGSLALGVTKLQTIIKVVIPAASPGILTGIILAVGRTIGETAVLLYTLGSSYQLVRSASSSARVLSLHLYLLFSEAISFERAFATAAVLVIIILLVNFATTQLVGKMNRMAGR
jgi:phosphate transport system permease protein